MSGEQCNRCRFWLEDKAGRDPNDPDWGFGRCRREPPRVSEAYVAALMPRLEYGQQADPEISTVEMTTASLFPATCSTDWCGHFDALPSSLLAMLAERNALITHIDDDGISEDEAQAECGRLNQLDTQIERTPAATRDDVLAKLLLAVQLVAEGHEVSESHAASIVCEAKSVTGAGRVSPNVAPTREA